MCNMRTSSHILNTSCVHMSHLTIENHDAVVKVMMLHGRGAVELGQNTPTPKEKGTKYSITSGC